MEYFSVRNWLQFQHYKHRNPPWIKLHYEVLSSRDWVSLNDESRVLAIACMLIASRNEGRVPDDPDYVQRVSYLNKKPNFNPLIKCGFLECASTCKRLRTNADTELELETETETERDCVKPNGSTPPQRFEDFWKHWPVKRNKQKALSAWKTKKLDESADDLIADIENRMKHDKQWKQGFIPHCSTYLNGHRWEDEYEN